MSESLQTQLRQELLQSLKQSPKDLKQDFQFIEGLLAHLETMLIRLKARISLENPLAQEIQAQYPEMYQRAATVIGRMPTFADFKLSSSEIAYIALHFMAARERYRESKKYSVLVICATGYGSAQMLKSRLENELGNLISITDVIGYYDINDDKLRGIDFIVSSIDLSNLIFSKPVFNVSVFLSEQELQTIKQGMAHLKAKPVMAQQKKLSQPLEPQVFDDYFSKDAFFIFSHASKQEVLTKLAQSIAHHEKSAFEQQLLDLVEQRETMSSIVFGDHIAVPHPIKAVGRQHRFAVALIKEGLFWDEAYPAIQLVFLMSMSVYDNEGLPELTSAIVDLVDDSDLQEQLLACESFEAFRTLFLRLKER